MATAFLDANVWFAAAYSKTGGSAAILELAGQADVIQIVANHHVLDEASRNLSLKSPHRLKNLQVLIDQAQPLLVPASMNPLTSQLLHQLVPASDVPVLAGAYTAKANYLVSLDRRHIVNSRLRHLSWPFQIVTPGEFLQAVHNS